MAANQIEAWTEICYQILMDEKCKPYEIYRIMCNVYIQAFLSKKYFYKEVHHNECETKRQSMKWKHKHPDKERIHAQLIV